MTTASNPLSGTISGSLARRAASFTPSFWGDLESTLAGREDLIFFGGGTPAPELIPVERLRAASPLAWTDAPFALDYGEVAGYRPLRELIAQRMAAQGMTVDPDHLVITNGSQQGIDLIGRLMLDPGDEIAIEAPTFLGALQTFAAYEVGYVSVPVDDHGLQVDALARILDERPRPPKLLYTIPTFQNPTGTTMPLARREALLALARERGLLVVEDDPYGELRYDGVGLPPLRALDPDVIYLGTFSKTIAPGLRAGWMAAPPSLVSLIQSAKEGADIHNERITTRTVFHAADGFLDRHLVELRAAYRRRRDALLAVLSERMPRSVRWSEPEGGFFVWVTLPEQCSAEELLPLAAERGVGFFPGAWFYPHQDTHNEFRLSFSSLPEERIVEGARRLAKVVHDHVRQRE